MTKQTTIAHEFLHESNPLALAKRHCVTGFMDPETHKCAFMFADGSVITGEPEGDKGVLRAHNIKSDARDEAAELISACALMVHMKHEGRGE